MPEAGRFDEGAVSQLAELGGADLIGELAEAYRKHAPDRIHAARSALAAGDRAALKVTAHTLKSSSAQLGALTARDLCRQIEQVADSAPVPELDRMLEELEEAIEQAHAWLKSWSSKRRC